MKKDERERPVFVFGREPLVFLADTQPSALIPLALVPLSVSPSSSPRPRRSLFEGMRFRRKLMIKQVNLVFI